MPYRLAYRTGKPGESGIKPGDRITVNGEFLDIVRGSTLLCLMPRDGGQVIRIQYGFADNVRRIADLLAMTCPVEPLRTEVRSHPVDYWLRGGGKRQITITTGTMCLMRGGSLVIEQGGRPLDIPQIRITEDRLGELSKLLAAVGNQPLEPRMNARQGCPAYLLS